MKPRPSRSGRRGMMLLEVMLAAAIFAIAGIALVSALNHLSQTYLGARQNAAVRMEISSRLAKAHFLPLIASKKTDAPDALGVTYEEEIAPLQVENDDHTELQGFWRVIVLAHWKEGKSVQAERGEVDVVR